VEDHLGIQEHGMIKRHIEGSRQCVTIWFHLSLWQRLSSIA